MARAPALEGLSPEITLDDGGVAVTKDEQRDLFVRVRDGLAASERLRTKPLSLDAELLRWLEAEGREARDTLFKFHQRLIWMMVRRRERKAGGRLQVCPEDMFQEGSFGLMRAIAKFDPDRGVPFSTYAYRWILQAMIRAHQQSGMIRIPCHVHDKYAVLEKEGTGSRDDLPRADTVLDGFVHPEDGETTRLGDLVEDEEATYQQEVRQEVSILLSKMSPEGAHLYRRHYLDGLSLPELAEENGCCRRTVYVNMQRCAGALVKNPKHGVLGR